MAPSFKLTKQRYLRQPSGRWFRIPVGVLLIVGGIFGFLNRLKKKAVKRLWSGSPRGLVSATRDIVRDIIVQCRAHADASKSFKPIRR